LRLAALAPLLMGPESRPAGLESQLARLGLRPAARKARESPQLELVAIAQAEMRRSASICSALAAAQALS